MIFILIRGLGGELSVPRENSGRGCAGTMKVDGAAHVSHRIGAIGFPIERGISQHELHVCKRSNTQDIRTELHVIDRKAALRRSKPDTAGGRDPRCRTACIRHAIASHSRRIHQPIFARPHAVRNVFQLLRKTRIVGLFNRHAVRTDQRKVFATFGETETRVQLVCDLIRHAVRIDDQIAV